MNPTVKSVKSIKSVIPTKLHTCTVSVQFYLTKQLIINTKVYD